MALVLGTNCGFVTVAPTADPAGTGGTADARCNGLKHTSPANTVRVTQMGWWCNTDTADVNYEIGIYSDAGAGEPELLLFVDTSNAKGTGTGWKTATVDFDIDPSTVYWLCLQLDDTSPTTDMDLATSGGVGSANVGAPTATTLPADWGTSAATDADGMAAIYALVEIAGGAAVLGSLAGSGGLAGPGGLAGRGGGLAG